MIQLTDSIWAVEVPDMATKFLVDMGYLIYKAPNYKGWVNDDILADYNKLQKHLKKYENEPDFKTGGSPLPPGNWQILCTLKECTPEIAAKVTQIVSTGKLSGKPQYRDFDDTSNIPANMWTHDPVKSLRSLIRVKGLDTETNILIMQNNSDGTPK